MCFSCEAVIARLDPKALSSGLLVIIIAIGGCMANLLRLILLFYSPFVWATIETIPATFAPVAVLVSYGGPNLATPELECQRMVTETAPWIYVSTGTVTAEYVQCFAKLPYDASPVFFGNARIYRRCDISWSGWAPVPSLLDCGAVYSCPATGGWTLSGSSCTRDVACPVAPLHPLDPAVQPYEDGLIDMASETQATRDGAACIVREARARRIYPQIVSGYRPPAYQTHIREVYDKWQLLKNNNDLACADTKSQVETEFDYHSPFAHQPGNTSRHSSGRAVDIHLSDYTVADTIAAGCNMSRPVANDRSHFESPR